MSLSQKYDPDVCAALQFVQFLKDKNYVTSQPIEKETIRNLFKNYEPIKTTKINFYILLTFMIDSGIIKSRSSNKDFIVFKPEVLHNYLNPQETDKNKKDSKKQKLRYNVSQSEIKNKSVPSQNTIQKQNLNKAQNLTENKSQGLTPNKNKNSAQNKSQCLASNKDQNLAQNKTQNSNKSQNLTENVPAVKPKRIRQRKRKRQFVTQNIAIPSPKQGTKYITKEKCEYCKCSFKNESEYSKHITKIQHILRQKYRTNKQSLLTEKMEIFQFETEQNGLKLTEIKSNINDHNTLTCKITNLDKNSYEITELILLYTQLKEIQMDYKLPIILNTNNSITITINFSFKYEGTYLLPIVFKIQNRTKEESEIYLLKELVFYIQSDIVNDLNPVEPYKKNKPVSYLEDLPIIDGVLPPKCHTNGLQMVRSLGWYKLSDTMIKLINCGLKVNEKLKPFELAMLKEIGELLKVPNKSKCLSPNNYCAMLQILLEFEEHQMWKNIRNYDCENQTLKKLPEREKYHLLALEVPGLAENRPSLIKGDDLMVRIPGGSCYYKGYIHKVKDTTVELGFFQRYVIESHFDAQKYSVTFGFNRRTIRTEHQAIELIEDHDVGHFFFPEKPIKQRPLEAIEYVWFQNKIKNNPQQQQAVKHIVSGTAYPYPYLLFGPPGTGKTMTLVEAILQLWSKKPKSRILVAAPSNSAANEVTSRLLQHVQKKDIYRMISQSFAFDKIPEDIKKISNVYDGQYIYPEMEILMEYRIVIVTLTCAAKFVWGGVPPGHFTHIFIDESGHSTESEVLIPIAGIITSQKKQGQLLGHIVLAGDPKQLGPIIHSKLAKSYGFDTSMLERLMNTCEVYQKKNKEYNPNLVTKLLKNFRSHSAILKLPDEMFYDKELVAVGNDLSNMALEWEELPNKKFPLIFHNVQGEDKREGNSPSYYNAQEIDVVIKYVSNLVGQKFMGRTVKQSDIGIVSPYRKQVHKLQDKCKRKNWHNILIGSVEQFQGQERLIIIISTVRSRLELVEHDYKFHLGFLKNPKRFNVAITRAKALVIVIGNPNILMWDEHWGKFIEYCSVNNALKGPAFEFQQLWKINEDRNNNEPQEEIVTGTDEHADFSRGNL